MAYVPTHIYIADIHTKEVSKCIWNAKVVKNRAAYCGVSRRVFERCGVYLNVEMNVQLSDQMSVH